MDPCAKSKARQAARSSAGGDIKDSRHSAPSRKHVEEHVSSTPHPPALAKTHAHQYIQSQKHVSHTVAQPTQQPPAANTMHQGTHSSAGKVSYHSAPLSKHREEPVSRTSYPPVLARPQAHQLIQSQNLKYGSGTVAQSKGQPMTVNPPAPNPTYPPRRL